MLEIKNIHIKYNREIITDSNLVFNDYGITVIKGESGSGKTSLIRNILFIEHQFEHYFYNKKEITSKYQIDHLFSVMDQKNLFIEDLKISEHFELLKKIYHSKSIDDYLERLEVKDTFNKYPGQLSGGEKNRISFLMCLLKNTPIIILDEPTAALDSYYTEEVKDIIVKESKDHLFIISTHDPVLFDIADTLYQIKNKKLICLKHNEMKKEIEDKRLKQTINIAKFFLKMKKHKLLSNILMLFILSISIVVTSLSAGYSLSDKNSHYDQVDSMVDKEVIVYKPIMQQHPYYFSGNSQEAIISGEELNEIKKIKGIESIDDYIELQIGSGHESIEQLEKNESHQPSFIVDNGKTKKKITSDDIISLVSYRDVNKKQLKGKLDKNGVYLSKEMAEVLKIKSNGNYILSFELPVPQCNIVGDGEISYMGEDELYPVNYLQCKYVSVDLKVAGIVDESKFCQWSCNNSAAIFVSDELIKNYMKQYTIKESTTYYFDKSQFKYVTQPNENCEITNVCYSYPWSPDALKIKIGNIKDYSTIVKNIKKLGFFVVTSNKNMTNLDQIAYRTSNSFVIFSVSITMVIIAIYLILKYIDLYKEKSFKKFMINLNYSKTKIRILMIEKYILDMFITIMTSLILLFVFQRLCIQLHYVIAPITTISIIMVILLPIIIEIIFPIVLGGLRYNIDV